MKKFPAKPTGVAKSLPMSPGSSGCSAADEPQPDKDFATSIQRQVFHDYAIAMVNKPASNDVAESAVAGRSADIGENRLLPCPFCGAEVALRYNDPEYWFESYSVHCNCGVDFYKTEKDDCIAAWNTRTNGSANQHR